MSGCFSEAEELPSNIAQEGWTPGPRSLTMNDLRRCNDADPERMGKNL
jgi:hypothetical protein